MCAHQKLLWPFAPYLFVGYYHSSVIAMSAMSSRVAASTTATFALDHLVRFHRHQIHNLAHRVEKYAAKCHAQHHRTHHLTHKPCLRPPPNA